MLDTETQSLTKLRTIRGSGNKNCFVSEVIYFGTEQVDSLNQSKRT